MNYSTKSIQCEHHARPRNPQNRDNFIPRLQFNIWVKKRAQKPRHCGIFGLGQYSPKPFSISFQQVINYWFLSPSEGHLSVPQNPALTKIEKKRGGITPRQADSPIADKKSPSPTEARGGLEGGLRLAGAALGAARTRCVTSQRISPRRSCGAW